MKLKRLFALGIVACWILVAISQAQEPAQQQESTPAVSQTQGVDNQGIKNYLLGPGDVLDVRVFGQDLSATAEVDSDGNISSLPFLEKPIPAKCRTEKQVQRDIAAAYSKFINSPQVSVRIVARNSRQPATVFGAVRQAARFQMQRKVRLNELMAASGGFTERASGTIQILHTEPLMCPGPGEEADAAPIDGTRIPMQIVRIAELRMGKLDANPVIRPGDFILVTEAEPVYITGSVVSPQGVYVRDQLTLTRALAMVGGVRKEAKTSEVRIYRQKPGLPEQETFQVDLAAIKKKEKPDIILQPYDIIDVPESGMLSSKRLLPTLMGAFSGGVSNVISGGLATRILY
jgi:polysaccharide export outer membrane protein